MDRFIVGTRGSRLSLIQTKIVVDALKKNAPNINVEIKTIKTSGDIDKSTPLYKLKGVGVFEKEIDLAIMNGDIDFAVHSLKDLPTKLPDGIAIAAIPERASPNDVLISKDGKKLEGLKKGAEIGTSSILRMAEIKGIRKDLKVKDIRGNVETRIAKLDNNEYDALILAEAGISRLGLSSRISQTLPLETFTPAAGQGALAVAAAEKRKDVLSILSGIDNQTARAEITAERTVTSIIGGGCEAAVGTVGRAHNGSLSLLCSIFPPNGANALTCTQTMPISNAVELGKKVSKELADKGAKDIIDSWHENFVSDKDD
ncbi:MAG: hydroxymethylbilane synthase [Candidatus Marsarchaeota archaeon]|nr:hydroxymethylbilane synthase [Candidatus Marsarchaeota archaeon]